MAKDKNVTIKFKADAENAKKGIDSISNQLNKFAKNVTKTNKPIINLLDSFNTVGKSFSLVKSAFSAASAAISDVTNAYNVQATAEKQLEAAAKNNPYLSDYSVDQLKKYAGELQSISTVGDEELLPMMAQLAASGRTQSEIQDIMAASLDISASGAMSLETAVKQLNATYSGSAGKLSQMSGAVKSLTTDQLKNGEAVKILKEQYSGIAKSVTESTGGWQQFKNTFGDLKETIGATFANMQNLAGGILNGVFSKLISAIQSAGQETETFQTKLNALATLDNSNASLKEVQESISQLKEIVERDEGIKIVLDLGGKKGGIEKYAKQQVEKAKKELESLESEMSKYYSDVSKWEGELFTLRNQNTKLEADYYAKKISQDEYLAKQTETRAKIAMANEELLKARNVQAEYSKKIATQNDLVTETEKKATEQAKEWMRAFSNVNGLASSTAALSDELEKCNEALKQAQKTEQELTADAKKNETGEAVKTTNELIEENKKKLAEQLEAINQKYELMREEGKEYDELSEKQEILSAKESAYLELLKIDVKDQRTLYNAANSRLVEIKKDYEGITKAIKEKADAEQDKKALEELKKETEKLAESARAFVSEFDETKLSAQIGAAILKMIELRDSTVGNVEAIEYYNEKIAELSGLLEDVQEKEAAAMQASGEDEIAAWASLHEQKFQIASDFAGKYSEIMSGITNLVTQNAENEAKIKQAALEEQLAAGEISEEEYAEKMEQIQKESAEKQYKAQMWEWTANLINIQAQTALAMVKALAQGGVAGPAMMAMIGALGGIQLATAIANKPIPPSFASGGVVGGFSGASMGDDNTYIHARNGEMVLNAMQQKAMWEQLNNGKQNGVSNNVTVKNYAAGNASATPKMTDKGIEIIIRDTVRKQIAGGDYDSQLAGAQDNMSGVRYVN